MEITVGIIVVAVLAWDGWRRQVNAQTELSDQGARMDELAAAMQEVDKAASNGRDAQRVTSEIQKNEIAELRTLLEEHSRQMETAFRALDKHDKAIANLANQFSEDLTKLQTKVTAAATQLGRQGTPRRNLG